MEDDRAIQSESFSDYGYTAFEKWPYRPMIYKMESPQSWRDEAESFYRASAALLNGVCDASLLEDVEGLAAVFLFRHYLELVLKQIIVSGRWLVSEDRNAAREDVKEVANVHELGLLWKWVLADAKPKMRTEVWENFDIEFIEQALAEFDAVDRKGFSFRYPGQGGEWCGFDFGWMQQAMPHVQQILGGILTYLVETRGENDDWESFLESEYGADLGWGR